MNMHRIETWREQQKRERRNSVIRQILLAVGAIFVVLILLWALDCAKSP